ncbi:MAG: carbohydrate ABC transporter permease, partial [Ktedonobacteraceae bacterium]|nr:carbohydrate ABC transporter permease [Ktedonobacteraceae bacterium]
ESTTIQVGLRVFLQENGNAWGELMAAAIVALLPVLLLYTVAQRHIVAAFVRSGIH